MQLDAYLFFTGNCKEAMEFYKEVFGGTLDMNMIDHVPEGMPESMKGKVMHASLHGGDVSFMASDGTRTEPYETSNITLSLSGKDEEKIRAAFEKLSEGGKVTTQIKKEMWGDLFGTVTDQFGIDWMVNISAS